MGQSVYRKDHSTETAVLSVHDCLLVKADERLVSLIALLDLSAAFDTHNQLDNGGGNSHPCPPLDCLKR